MRERDQWKNCTSESKKQAVPVHASCCYCFDHHGNDSSYPLCCCWNRRHVLGHVVMCFGMPTLGDGGVHIGELNGDFFHI
jgi:hypothetical protein